MVPACFLLLVFSGIALGFSTTSIRSPRSPLALRLKTNIARGDCAVREINGFDASEHHSDQSSQKDETEKNSSRRSFLQLGISAGLASPLFVQPERATAVDQLQAGGVSLAPNLKCLLDLPPVDSGSVRIFLCRHGQTENNRLGMVQGARVDAPLNDTGRSMARRLGAALSFLPDGMAPTVAAHSLLRRARETATIADATLGKVRTSTISTNRNPQSVSDSFLADGEGGVTDFSVSHLPLNLEVIPSLGEIDFGATIEGRPSIEVRAGMYATYGAWSVGNIDQVMDGEGESGRQVLYRAADALKALANIASKTGGSVVAVSHSSYLRMLLSAVMNIPLTQGAALTQNNGCINVLDVSIEKPMKELGPKSELLGGKLSMARDFSLYIPETKVVRVNESRHLNGLV